MTPKTAALILGALTLASIVGMIVLVALGRLVPPELYAFTGMGFGGHLALAPSALTPGPSAAVMIGLDELLKAAQALTPTTTAPQAPAAATAPLSASPAAPRAPTAPLADVPTPVPVSPTPATPAS